MIVQCGYVIIKEERIDNEFAVVLGYKMGAASPWVTWIYNNIHESYSFGHYFCDETNARIDYHERVAHMLNSRK